MNVTGIEANTHTRARTHKQKGACLITVLSENRHMCSPKLRDFLLKAFKERDCVWCMLPGGLAVRPLTLFFPILLRQEVICSSVYKRLRGHMCVCFQCPHLLSVYFDLFLFCSFVILPTDVFICHGSKNTGETKNNNNGSVKFKHLSLSITVSHHSELRDDVNI